MLDSAGKPGENGFGSMHAHASPSFLLNRLKAVKPGGLRARSAWHGGVLPELLKHCAELDLLRSMDRLLAGTQPSLLEVRFLTYLCVWGGVGWSEAPAHGPRVAGGRAHCGASYQRPSSPS